MDVGMMMVFASYGWENCSDGRVWDEEIRLARLAARSGFDCLWSAEHHFNDYSFVPDNLVVYLCAAGNADGPVRSRSRRVNQPALTSQIRVSEPDVTLFNCLRAHMGRSTPRSSPSSATYTLCGCGHGGTRNSSTSRNVQT